LNVLSRPIVFRVVNALVAIACCAFVGFFLPVPTVTDYHLPLFCAAIAIAATVMRDDRRSRFVLSGSTLLIVARLSFGEMPLRFAAYGVIVAVAVVIAFTDVIEDEEKISLGRAVGLLVAIALPFRFVAVTAGGLLPNALAIAGGVLMLLLLSSRRRVPADTLVAAVLTTLVTPAAPLRLSLFSTFAASLAWFAAAPSPFSVVAVLFFAALCGKWFVALALLVFVLAAARDRRVRRSPEAGAPVWISPAVVASSARIAALGVDCIAAVRRNSSLLPFVLLFLVTAVVKPGVAVLFGVATLAIFSAVASTALTRGLTGALCIYWLMTAAWGGVIRHMLPLAASLFVIAVIALMLFLPRIIPFARIAATAIAVCFFAVIAMQTRPAGQPVAGAFSLTPGDSRSFRIQHSTTHLGIIGAGANIVSLAPGTKLGTIDFVDADGRAYRHTLSVGDLSDWGTFRDGHFLSSRNPLPDEPAGRVMGEGTNAVLTGAGRITLTAKSPIVGVSVTADDHLPRNARLNFESVESEAK
jgi:hypothetical protein